MLESSNRGLTLVKSLIFLVPSLSIATVILGHEISNHKNEFLLKEAASIELSENDRDVDTYFDKSSDAILLVDRRNGRLREWHWKTGAKTEWVTIDASPCLSRGGLAVDSVLPMHKMPYLIITICGSVEIADKTALPVLKKLTSIPVTDALQVVLSPDERSLAVVERQERGTPKQEDLVKIYRTADWTLTTQWRMSSQGANLNFTPDGKSVVTFFGGNLYDRCGFISYDLLSGRITKEWNFDKSSADCPNFLFSIFAKKSGTSVFGKVEGSGSIVEWDLDRERVVNSFPDDVPQPSHVSSFSFSTDQRLMGVNSVASSEGSSNMEYATQIWDVQTGNKIYEKSLHDCYNPMVSATFLLNSNHVMVRYPAKIAIFEYSTAQSR